MRKVTRASRPGLPPDLRVRMLRQPPDRTCPYFTRQPSTPTKDRMAAPSRTAQFTKLHKILKKRFTPVAPDPNRSVLEHLLFASCLENAHPGAAEEAFAALVHTFFDWNEIRVSSVRELVRGDGRSARPARRREPRQADPPERVRRHLLLRPRRPPQAEPRRGGRTPGEDRRDNEIHRRLRDPGRARRTFDPDRFRHPGSPAACSTW